jgi:hypothetical protein
VIILVLEGVAGGEDLRGRIGDALRPQLGKFSGLRMQNYVRAASSSPASLGGSGASPDHFEDDEYG